MAVWSICLIYLRHFKILTRSMVLKIGMVKEQEKKLVIGFLVGPPIGSRTGDVINNLIINLK